MLFSESREWLEQYFYDLMTDPETTTDELEQLKRVYGKMTAAFGDYEAYIAMIERRLNDQQSAPLTDAEYRAMYEELGGAHDDESA